MIRKDFTGNFSRVRSRDTKVRVYPRLSRSCFMISGSVQEGVPDYNFNLTFLGEREGMVRDFPKEGLLAGPEVLH